MHSKIYRSRLLVCILSMMIMMTTIFPINTLAVGNLGVSVGSITGAPGGSVVVPVSLSNIPGAGLAATSIIITFDDTKLELTGVSAGGIVPTATDVATDTGDVIQSSGKAKIFYSDDNAGLSNTHITTPGILANLTFSLGASASGTYTLGVDAASEATENDEVATTIPYSDMNISTGILTVNASTYTVTFDSQGGSAVTNTSNVTSGSGITAPPAPTWAGYTFGGWYKEAGCTNAWTFNTDIVTNNVTIYAKWTANQNATGVSIGQVTGQAGGSATVPISLSTIPPAGIVATSIIVTFDSTKLTLTGVSAGGIVPTAADVATDINDVIQSPGKAKIFYFDENAGIGNPTTHITTNGVLANLTFSIDASASGEYNFGVDVASEITDNDVNTIGYNGMDISTGKLTVNPVATYTVSFDAQGGSTVTSISNVTTGSTISAQVEPTYTGYTFGGWYKESSCITLWDFSTDIVTNNVTIYAKWTANSVTTYTVSFDAQGGSAVAGLSNVTTGSTISAPTDPTWTGYTFGGWYKESDCIIPWDFSTDSITNNVTIYAKWTANPSSGSGSSSSPHTSTPTPTTVTGEVINETGESVQGVEAQVTVETDGTSTVAVKSNEAILLKQPDGTKAPLSDSSKLGFLVEGNTDPNATAVVTLSADGTIQVKNLANGTETQIVVTYDLGNGQKITIGTINIKVGSNGAVSLTSTLIDPYGIITDSATGKVITGADVTLYYANTARNIAAGKTPDTVVALPGIDGFKPNDNANPQISDLNGAYGFMVYPTSDYYIVATKEGYDEFRSPTIPVEQEIVRLDFKMNQPKIGLIRLAGLNSVDTALEIAKANYTGQVSNVILATAENYPDALAGSVLGYKLNAPILLVGSSEEDQNKVISYMKDYMKKNGTVFILGGNVAVSDAVEGKITASGFSHITRLGGIDRYETALKIADALDVKTGTPIILAYGENYPDALSISSAAATMQYPIFLIGNNGISAAVQQKIAQIKPIRVYIIGGQAVISSAVEGQVSELTTLGEGSIVRLSGIDRYETSLAVANYFKLAGQNVCIATGNNFPDALTGSVYAANSNAPIILTDLKLSDKIMDYLKTRKSTGITIFGGEVVVSKAIEQELSQMLGK